MANKEIVIDIDTTEANRKLTGLASSLKKNADFTDNLKTKLANMTTSMAHELGLATSDVTKSMSVLDRYYSKITRAIATAGVDAGTQIHKNMKEISASTQKRIEETKTLQTAHQTLTQTIRQMNSEILRASIVNSKMVQEISAANKELLKNKAGSAADNATIRDASRIKTVIDGLKQTSAQSKMASDSMDRVEKTLKSTGYTSATAANKLKMLETALGRVNAATRTVNAVDVKVSNYKQGKNVSDTLVSSIIEQEEALKRIQERIKLNNQAYETTVALINKQKETLNYIRDTNTTAKTVPGGQMTGETNRTTEKAVEAYKETQRHAEQLRREIQSLEHQEKSQKALLDSLNVSYQRLDETMSKNKTTAGVLKSNNDALIIQSKSLTHNIEQQMNAQRAQIQETVKAYQTLGTTIDKAAKNMTTATLEAKNRTTNVINSNTATIDASRLVTTGNNSLIKDANKITMVGDVLKQTAQQAKIASESIERMKTTLDSAGYASSSAYTKLRILHGLMAEIREVSRTSKAISVDVKSYDHLKDTAAAVKNAQAEQEKVLEAIQGRISATNKAHEQTLTLVKQQELALQELKNKLSNISNETGTKAPADIAKKLEAANKAYQEVQVQAGKYQVEIKKLEREEQSHKATIDSLTTSLQRLQGIMDRQTGNISGIKATNDSIRANTAELTKNINEQIKTQGVLSKTGGAFRLLSTQTKAIIFDLQALRAAFYLVASSSGAGLLIRTLGDFDKTMARLQSLMLDGEEATSGLKVQFNALRETVIQLGATTKFTASEVGKASVILMQAGLGAIETIKTLKPTLDLAVAGALEMESAAEAVAKTMMMFNLSTEETARIADVYAKAANLSATSVEKLMTAMTYTGSVAHNFGLTLEETNAFLGSLANAGIDASVAGTSLRRVMVDLIKPTAASRGILEAYGISLQQLKAKGMTAAEALKTVIKTIGTTPDIANVFRVTAIPSVQSLAQNMDGLDGMIEKLKQAQGYAEKVAKINMNNLKDQIIQVKSAIEEFTIRFGDATGMTDGLTELMRTGAMTLREWNTDMQHAIKRIAEFALGALSLYAIFKKLETNVMINGKMEKATVSLMQRTGMAFKNAGAAALDFGSKAKTALTSITAFKEGILSLGKAVGPFALQVGAAIAITEGLSFIISRMATDGKVDMLKDQYSDLAEAIKSGSEDAKMAIEALEARTVRMQPIELKVKSDEAIENIKQLNSDMENTLNSLIKKVEGMKASLQGSLDSDSISAMAAALNIPQEEVIADIEAQIGETEGLLGWLNNLSDAVQTGEIANVTAVLNDMPKNVLGSKTMMAEAREILKVLPILDAAKQELEIFQKALNPEKKLSERAYEIHGLAKFSDLLKTAEVHTAKFAQALSAVSVNAEKTGRAIPNEMISDYIDELVRLISDSTNMSINMDDIIKYNWDTDSIDFTSGFKEQLNGFERYVAEFEYMIGRAANASEDGMLTIENAMKSANMIPESMSLTKDKIGDLTKRVNEMKTALTGVKGVMDMVMSANEQMAQMKQSEINNKIGEKAYDIDNLIKARELIHATGKDLLDLRETVISALDTKGVEGFINTLIKRNYPGIDLSKPFIELGTTLKTTTALGLNLQEVYNDLMEMSKQGQLTDSLQTTLNYLKVIKNTEDEWRKKQADKKTKKPDLKDNGYTLEWLKTVSAINQATYALDGHIKQQIAVLEIQEKIEKTKLEAASRKNNKDLTPYLNALNEQLKVEQAIAIAKRVDEQDAKDAAHIAALAQIYSLDTGIATMEERIRKEHELKLAIIQATASDVSEKRVETMRDELRNIQEINAAMQQQAQITGEIANKEQELSLMRDSAVWISDMDQAYLKELELLDLKRSHIEIQRELIELENQRIAASDYSDTEKEALMKKNELLLEQLRLKEQLAQKQASDNSTGMWDGITRGFENAARASADAGKVMENAVGGAVSTIEQGLATNLVNVLKGNAADWRSMCEQLAADFALMAVRMIATQLMLKAVGLALGSVIPGASAGTEAASGATAPTVGGAGNSIMFAASGGIVDRPSMMTSKKGHTLVGEAGPEAIMPLKRLSNGKMGVYTEGGAGKNIMTNNNFSFQINMEGSSGDKDKDTAYAEAISNQIRAVIQYEIKEWQTKQMRDGGILQK